MDNQKLGIFITELRKEKGLTQAQLAQKLNVTDKAVSKWERGVGFPDIKLLEPLADVLDISLLELMKSERLPKTTVSAPDTTDAFQNVIDLASYERKIERQRIALVTLFIVLLIALIFLVDIMQSFGFLFVCLPIILFFLGIWFLRLSHKKSTHKHAFFVCRIARVCISALPYSAFLFCLCAWRSGSELIGYNRKGRYRMQYLPFLHLINFSEFQHRLLNMDCRSQRIFLHPLSLRKPDRPAVFQIPGFQAPLLLHRHGSVRKH